MKMKSKDFILVSNLCRCTAPLDGNLCVGNSFKQIIRGIFQKKTKKTKKK